MRKILFPALLGLSLLRAAAQSQPPPPDAAAIAIVRTQLGDMRDALEEYYYPRAKFTPAFIDRCAATDKALGGVKSLSEAYGLIADTLGSLDPRIRFYPPSRTSRVDYSWTWQLIGPGVYVTQVDREGGAATQGLKLGDRVLSLEGIPVTRENSQQVYYVFKTLAPRPGLRVQVQSPGQEPRWLAIPSTVRPQRKLRADGSRTYTPEEKRRFEEFLDPKNHVRMVGSVAVWQAQDLLHDTVAVAKGLKLVAGATGLVLDLRGLYVSDRDPVLRLLDGLFAESFESGVVEKAGLNDRLSVSGGSQSFHGTVLVLVDSDTAAFAEVLTRMIQQRQRGVIMGDRTMGRAFQETLVGFARGRAFSFNVGGVRVPSGEVKMADGVPIDGRGVAPDYQLLPTPADLAGHRDVVMAKALGMLKQPLSPEEAYKLFPHYEDVDDEYGD